MRDSIMDAISSLRTEMNTSLISIKESVDGITVEGGRVRSELNAHRLEQAKEMGAVGERIKRLEDFREGIGKWESRAWLFVTGLIFSLAASVVNILFYISHATK